MHQVWVIPKLAGTSQNFNVIMHKSTTSNASGLGPSQYYALLDSVLLLHTCSVRVLPFCKNLGPRFTSLLENNWNTISDTGQCK